MASYQRRPQKIRLYDKEVAFEKQIVLDLNPSKKGIAPSVSSLALDHKNNFGSVPRITDYTC